ncbi:NAD(P)-binding protein [Xylaria intraflava]|nr:NAD(P)-binding protein [Xylaria intraflava]
MEASVLITGANGSLGIEAVGRLLQHYPKLTAILTVRDPDDINSQRLKDTIAKHPGAKAIVQALDLSDLSAVRDFATKLAADISNNSQPPLCAIIATAYHWNLVRDPELTVDGYDKTFQVGHIAHVFLILRLLECFGPEGGRIVLFSSDSHWPGKNGLQKYPPEIPQDVGSLAEPKAGKDKLGLGFLQYACTKLAITAWMYALNTHLKQDVKLNKITAVAINPGNLIDSRALRVNTPKLLCYIQKFVLRPLLPLVQLSDPTARLVSAAAADVIDLAVSEKFASASGFYTLLSKDVSSPESMNEDKQRALWTKSIEWAHIDNDEIVLK